MEMIAKILYRVDYLKNNNLIINNQKKINSVILIKSKYYICNHGLRLSGRLPGQFPLELEEYSHLFIFLPINNSKAVTP